MAAIRQCCATLKRLTCVCLPGEAFTGDNASPLPRLPHILSVVLLTVACVGHAQTQFVAPVQVGQLSASQINEASGLAASRFNASVLWTHNDSGDSARVFAINTQGQLLGTYTLTGASAVDWEDIAIGPGPTAGQSYLYTGDIGDNSAKRSNGVRIYRAAEPTVAADPTTPTTASLPTESFVLKYPDGPRDAETLMVDPITGDVYVVSKRDTRGRVYRAPAEALVNGATITMEYTCSLPWSWATGGDISPDGDAIVIRGYFNASVWMRPAGSDLASAFAGQAYSVPLPSEAQGEAIAFDATGRGYFTVSEGANAPIYHIAATPEPATLAILSLAMLASVRRRV
jgi:hypothetical protein